MKQIYITRIAKQPIFDFMIPSDGFYLNTHGVSITESGRSTTNLTDGLFYILNKNTQPIYFNSLTIDSVSFRDSSNVVASKLSKFLPTTTYDDYYRYDDYYVKYNGLNIGKLRIRTQLKYVNDSNTQLKPFQSIEFGSLYSVENINQLNLHYNNPSGDKKNTLDFIFVIKCFTDKELTKIVTDTITITVNVINTGYVAAAQEPPPITIQDELFTLNPIIGG